MNSRRPLKIGITCYPSVGGSGVIATALGIELAKRGHEVHFISYERPFRLPENMPGILFHPVIINSYGLFKYPDYTLPLSVEMARVSCKHDLDILHVHYAVPHATAAALAMCMLPPEKRPSVVTTLHGTDTTLLGKDPGYEPIIHHSLLKSDAITTVSEFLAGETRRVFSLEREMHVIHNFYEPSERPRSREDVRTELGVKEGEALIVHSSNLRPLKRIDLLLETIARAKQTTPDLKLLVLAGGDFAPFVPELERLGIKDSVVVRENVVEIDDYLQAADIGLYTSETESFCLSILEAMFFGCPSVARRVGGIPEVVDDERTGLLIDSADVNALATAVSRLVSDADLRNRLGHAAKLRARELFTAQAIVPRYEQLYYEMVDTATGLKSSGLGHPDAEHACK